MLVLEDLHWSDVSTVNLLTYLAQRRDPRPAPRAGDVSPGGRDGAGAPAARDAPGAAGRGLCDDLALELLLLRRGRGIYN